MKTNLKSHPMYWLYNMLLLFYWAILIPQLIYRLIREEGFYQRIKQSIGFLPDDLKEKISNRHAIWVHAASVGEIVAASPIVREMRKTHPNEVIIVSVVTATGFRMAHQIIKGADGILYFPLDLPYLTNRILTIVNPQAPRLLSKSKISTKLNIFGPTIIGLPWAAGSKILWPPI